MRKIGDILRGSDRRKDAALHYIIYLDDFDGHDFIGAMITSTVWAGVNVPMKTNHFSNDPRFKIKFKKSQLVKAKLRKIGNWGPFTKVGELTTDGIDFVKQEVYDLPLETFVEYESRPKGKYLPK